MLRWRDDGSATESEEADGPGLTLLRKSRNEIIPSGWHCGRHHLDGSPTRHHHPDVRLLVCHRRGHGKASD